jgi:hypothetical protein
MKEHDEDEDDDFLDEDFKIKSAQYQGDLTLRIEFTDGLVRVVNFRPFLENAHNESIRSYLDEKKFKDYNIIDGNLNWHDYELIFPISDLRKGHFSYQY